MAAPFTPAAMPDAPLDARTRFAQLPAAEPLREYNFEHFTTKHLVRDARRTAQTAGIKPGELAPDFTLPMVGGGTLRLADLRGRPVVLHFGSFSWPVSGGSVEPLKQLHAIFGDRVHFVDVLIRQAHPGPSARPYASDADKRRDAERLQRDEAIPYPVVVDDLPGTTHQAYGGLADPTYLLDADGRVAFYSMWTHAPTLHQAIERLAAQGNRGVAGSGVDRTPHLLSAVADGWHALRRGLPQSYTDLELSAPGMGAGVWLGYQLRPVLAPLALRARPLPPAARLGLAVAAGAAVALLVGRRRGNR